MAKKIVSGYTVSDAKKTSIGCSKNTRYNKACQKRNGKKAYRGQGR